MEIIDSFLNKITMYKLTLYYLIALISYAIVLSFFNLLPFKPFDIIVSTIVLVNVSLITNYIFAKLFNAVTNVESVYITSLILALIIPLSFPLNLKFIIEAAVFSTVVKYFLTVGKRHIFNPAAASAVIVALLTGNSATWWVGTPFMLPVVLIGGILLAKKIRREDLVFSFFIAYFFIIGVGSVLHLPTIASIISTWRISILHSAVFFFAFVMLTEPLTSPTTKRLQSYFGYVVAVLYATPQLRLGAFGLTPEMALCVGNALNFFINPNYRLDLILKAKRKLSEDTYEFAFQKSLDFRFIPGQYMEWTLPHQGVDSRGNRRYFSISSSPTENEISMTVKFNDPSSSYKKNLIELNEGGKIIAAQVAGDFTLPEDLKKPIVFIAGGVGIAPFKSMIKYIVDNNLSVDVTLIYSNRNPHEILFDNIFDKAKANGVKKVYLLTDSSAVPKGWSGGVGHVSEDLIKSKIPNYQKSTYYISGPQLMVQGVERTLRGMGVKQSMIITDFFPGYSEKK